MDMRRFRSTLGHKLNHSFSPNVRFETVDSPRFGIVMCMRTTRPIRRGEELLNHYGYRVTKDAPLWYLYGLRDFLREHPGEANSDVMKVVIGNNLDKLDSYLRVD